jgi:hypothetical protein
MCPSAGLFRTEKGELLIPRPRRPSVRAGAETEKGEIYGSELYISPSSVKTAKQSRPEMNAKEAACREKPSLHNPASFLISGNGFFCSIVKSYRTQYLRRKGMF